MVGNTFVLLPPALWVGQAVLCCAPSEGQQQAGWLADVACCLSFCHVSPPLLVAAYPHTPALGTLKSRMADSAGTGRPEPRP